MKTLLPIAAAATLLCACTDGTAPSSGTETNTASPSTGPSALQCEAGNNLLANAEFATNVAGAAPPWMSSQHAGEKSFELTLANGTAKIEKIATQPWFTLSQGLQATPLRGQTLEYSAELKLDLNEEGVNHGFKVGGGLMMTLRGDPDPVMGGDRLLASEKFEHEPHMGTWDWTPVTLRFTVPENATSVRLGFAQYANGSMEIRKPALYRCSAVDQD
ncbi:hypothetical protein FV139_01355 [Parahaliea maris]|uniref:Lipoprotein n=1 Tax=Parahaliea maris TaxID=2716870 RepID=A0A5C9AA64_9GAMM|nr:hypothetical protein [Parahaliea maris]TXS96181.1 hypothetical protein FV139_01355 [Parahaliea maris]